MDWRHLNLTFWVSFLLTLCFSWAASLCIYRLFFHPLAKIPGPLLARVSYWYEIYYDLALPGQYTFKLKDLHKEYGTAVRINPNELHINDPDYYDAVFNTSNGKTNKSFKEANAFGPYPAAIGTLDHDLHRIRRSALNPFFSRKSVFELLPFVSNIVENLCSRLEDASKMGEDVNLKYAYNALTMDVMTEYCFSQCANRVFVPDFDRKAFDDIDKFVVFSLWNVHFPWLMGFLYSLPEWFARLTSPAMADTFDFRKALSDQVEAIRSGKEKSYESSGHRTIFHSLLESKLPPEEMQKDRLRDEAFSMVTAGSGTTAHFLKCTTYRVMADRSIHSRLFKELTSILPTRDSPVDLTKLEQLPFLTAIIYEGLRINHTASHRVQRIFHEKALKYKDITILPGTEVGMTAILMHDNEEIFPDHKRFNPDRWLIADQHRLLRYLAPFTRGPRACLGMNLAWAEMYLTLAYMFRRFEFDVSQVKPERDIDMTRDLLIGAAAPDSPGVIVRVKRVTA